MVRRLVVVAALFALAACSKDEGTPPPPPLSLTASTSTAPADGVSTVTITVSGSSAPPITVSTTRGTFPNGQKSTSLADNGSVVLSSCNAATDSTCAGSTTVSASDTSFATGRLTLTFTSPTAEVCNNGSDDDGDSLADCADPDCSLQACTVAGGGSGTCQGTTCVAAVCTPSAEVCDSGADEDCDGDVDCADADCAGQQCSASNAALVCSAGSCVDVSAGLGLQISAGRTRLPADGLATTPVTVTVVSDGSPVAGTTVSLSTDLGSVTPASAVTDAEGVAAFEFTASASAGTATLTASVGGTNPLSLTTQIVMPALGSIQLSSIQNPVMGVRTSGFNEQNAIQVLLLDTEQKPYPDGLQVEFQHSPLGGSEISTPWTDSAGCTAPACLRFLGATRSPAGQPDSAGLAAVNLYSGTAAGLVSVRVAAAAGGVGRTFTVQNVAIVGAKASGGHVSVFCTPLNVPALIYDDCTNSFSGGGDGITCTAYLADRFNNVLGRATRVDFRSEAGSPGPPVLTNDYDPVQGGDQTASLGFADNTVLVTGYAIPRDVAPLAGEFSASFDSGCGTVVHNPRDGLGTVIAAVQGEEGFVDRNGNGLYDAGEPFVDAGEPFVDEDDDGVRDADEAFIDVDQDGAWTGPNGAWDSDAVIWAEARVLYTGLPWQIRWLDPADVPLLPGPTPLAAFSVNGTTPGPATSQVFAVYFADRNYNHMATSASFDVGSLFGNVDAEYVSSPLLVDNLGMSFTQQFCDAAPPAVPTACYGTCRTSPCYRVARIGSFRYGNLASALITGATAGADAVEATVTLHGIVTAGTIAGTCN